ncbi:PDZ domain-containing protein [Streptomyces sp. f51]|uniref:PDZ domain-containing protein n=1 Tax=Streptomyces sp. f51 TaxID=1827742 RepID=UPI0030D4BC59
MEQAALRPKPMPGRDPGGGARSSRGARRPREERRRGRRLVTLSAGVFAGAVLVLSGVGIGAVGATVVGAGGLAELRERAGAIGAAVGAAGPAREPSAGAAAPGPGADGAHLAAGSGAPTSAGSPAPGPGGTGVSPPTGSEREPVRGTLGVEAVDAPAGPGALIVGVHVPGPGCTAGLVRGDVLLALDGTRITSAADLARAVADAAPGREVTLRVRHANGGRGRLTAVPGTAT